LAPTIAVGLTVICALAGHMFPVWLGFRGGKGVTTGVGVFIGLAPKAVLIVLGVFAVVLAISRYVSLASIIATAAFPVCAHAFLKAGERGLLPFMCLG